MSELSKSIGDCQFDAVLLKGMLESIELLDSEDQCKSGRAALIIVALEKASQLAKDLDGLEKVAKK